MRDLLLLLFCSGVNDITEADKTDQAAFPFDEAAEMKALGALGPVGEKGFTTLERRSGCCPAHT